MNFTSLALALGGLVVLTAGAELLVRCASRLATSLGVSALVVGLTVVAFGTSAPEIVVSATAALSGKGAITLGNIVGSNIANILLILGLSAAITPLVVTRKLLRFEVPLMVAVTFGAAALAWDGSIGRVDGLLLCAGLALFTWSCVRMARRGSAAVRAEFELQYGPRPASRRWGLPLLTLGVLVGLTLLVLGSKLFVSGAVDVARAFGVSELVIGLTIVAIGTSMPEVATSVLAALRGEREIAIGNVVGSNLFNLLGALGLSGALAPGGVPVPEAALHFDIPVMLAASVACLPVLFTGFAIARWEGWLFLGYYASYLSYLVLAAGHHDALPAFSAVMSFFVIPLTVIGLVLGVVRTWRRERELARTSSSSRAPDA